MEAGSMPNCDYCRKEFDKKELVKASAVLIFDAKIIEGVIRAF
jgi:hypothetical protein